MSVDGPDVHTLTGAYALDALSGDDRERFEDHLAVCEACRREVAEFQATAAKLAAASAAPSPPELRGRVLRQIDQIRQAPPRPSRQGERSPSSTHRRRRRIQWALASTAAAVLALAVVTADVGAWRNDPAPGAADVAELLARPDARVIDAVGLEGGLARLVVAPAIGEAALIVSGWPAAPSDHVFQLWLIGPDGTEPAGTFGTDASGGAVQALSGRFDVKTTVGITVEPSGGSLEPTSEPIAVFEL